jgi:hypothetical protein
LPSISRFPLSGGLVRSELGLAGRNADYVAGVGVQKHQKLAIRLRLASFIDSSLDALVIYQITKWHSDGTAIRRAIPMQTVVSMAGLVPLCPRSTHTTQVQDGDDARAPQLICGIKF